MFKNLHPSLRATSDVGDHVSFQIRYLPSLSVVDWLATKAVGPVYPDIYPIAEGKRDGFRLFPGM